MLAVALLVAAIPLGHGVPAVDRSSGVDRGAGSGAGAGSLGHGRVDVAEDGRFELAAETAALSAVPASRDSASRDAASPVSPLPVTASVDTAAPSNPFGTLSVASQDRSFDAGDIISDATFYDTTRMTEQQISAFVDQQGAACSGPSCLRTVRVATTDQPADRYCSEFRGAAADAAAAIISKVSRACGVNPQVMLVTLQKESRLLDRTDPSPSTYDAAWGWHCPDTGPGGTAACDPAHAGLFAQAYGMAKQWARYRLDPDRYHYRAGQTADILYNVVESGCGSAPVTIANTATASLYNYTPYQPNTASLAAYPGVGDRCSSYGNRNFFFLFGRYFGGTGLPAVGASPVTLAVPDNRYVDEAIAGRTITVPNAAVARGLRAGFAALGMPYVWGGGGSGAGPDNGCRRGGGQYNSCGREIGFDCSGLSAYVLGRAGFTIPGDSAAQRRAGVQVGWDQALPGDIVGFPGHVAVYLGAVAGERYILEASWVGYPVHVVRLTRGDADQTVHRYWNSAPGVGATAIAPTFTPRAAYAAPPAGTAPRIMTSAPVTSASTTPAARAAESTIPASTTPASTTPASTTTDPTTPASSTAERNTGQPTSKPRARSSSAPSTGATTATTSSIPSPTIPSTIIPSPTSATTMVPSTTLPMTTVQPDQPPSTTVPSTLTLSTATAPNSPTMSTGTPQSTTKGSAPTTTSTPSITRSTATTDGQNQCPQPPPEETTTATTAPTAVPPTMVPTASTTEVPMTAFEVAVRTLTSGTPEPTPDESDCGATETDIADN